MTTVTSAATAAAARIGAALSDAQYFESSMVRPEDIRRQLDSRSTKDKLDAMKRVIALISLGKDASMFFPDVVKNVVASSLDVKKLVYLYLVHYAELKQDLALLAINSFQKDLSDPNQHIRALSLRVLSSIRVKVILQVVILAISNAAKDSSAYVRKTAALAISKVCALDVSSKDLLLEPLQMLLSDRSVHVIGSAFAAYDDVCPYDWDMIHPHYRRICNSLSTVEPWGQIAIIHTLLRYARTHFSDPYLRSSTKSSGTSRNPDLSLLLDSVAPLFMSLNHGVVASAMAVFFHLGTSSEFCSHAIKPLMRMITTPDDGGQAVALHIASAVAIRFPHVLIPYVSEFYVSPAHSAPIRNLRIKVLLNICLSAGRPGGIGSKPDARRTLLAELKEYLFCSDKHLAAASARAIGCFATAHPPSTSAVVKVLSSVVASADNPVVVSESIAVLRQLLQRHPNAQAKALPQLIALLLAGENCDGVVIRDAAARSSIIWLIAEFYEKVQPIATEALRLLARGFAKEASKVKIQILNLAAKVVAWNNPRSADVKGSLKGDLVPSNHVRQRLLEYVISCARYDRDYDVRDKARMLHSVFISNAGTLLFEAAKAAYLSRKPIPPSSGDTNTGDYVDSCLDSDVVIGSMAHVLTGRRLFGFRPLEAWAEVDSNSVLRENDSSDTNGTAGDRDYIGVGSSNFSHLSSVNVASVSWNTPQIVSAGTTQSVSSGSINRVGGTSYISGGLARSGVRYSPPNAISSHPNSKNEKFINLDPEKFYNDNDDLAKSGGEGDDEDDGDMDDDEVDDNIDEDDSESPVDEESDEGIVADHGRVDPNINLFETKSGPLDHDPLINTIDLISSNGEVHSQPMSAGRASEYDLDALLGGFNISPAQPKADVKGLSNLSGHNFPSTSNKNLSQWFRVVESWNANGLEIDAGYSRDISSAGADITPIVIRVTNRSKNDITNISLESKCGDCFSCLEKIDLLPSNDSVEIKAEGRFRGKTSGVRFGIRTGGQFIGEGEFKPLVGFLVRPRPGISPNDFMEAEKKLTGMFASKVSIILSEPKQNDWMRLSTCIKEKMFETCFLSHIKTSVGNHGASSLERFSMVFAGYLPSATIGIQEQRPVLLRLTAFAILSENGCKCDIWIGCEDVLFTANLMRSCRNFLMSINGNV